MARKIFVNLPVKDLDKAKEFFGKLGFTFNAQFTDETAVPITAGMLQVAIRESFKDTSYTVQLGVDPGGKHVSGEIRANRRLVSFCTVTNRSNQDEGGMITIQIE